MKRFVLPELFPAFVLLAMGVLIHVLEHSGGTLGNLVAIGLFGVAVWVVYRPQKLIAAARAVAQSASWRRPQ